MYSCKKATELVDKSETEKLSFLTNIRLRLHLMMCPPCAIYKKQSQQLSNWIKNNAAKNAGNTELSEDSKKKIIENLKKNNTKL